MADHAAVTSSGSTPVTVSASTPDTTPATVAAPYVQPMPVTPSALASTSTSVVLDQARVPSPSGASVGTVYAVSLATGGAPTRHIRRET
jgi:hypothetical protein